jgi:hypothetical protein
MSELTKWLIKNILSLLICASCHVFIISKGKYLNEATMLYWRWGGKGKGKVVLVLFFLTEHCTMKA